MEYLIAIGCIIGLFLAFPLILFILSPIVFLIEGLFILITGDYERNNSNIRSTSIMMQSFDNKENIKETAKTDRDEEYDKIIKILKGK